MSDVRAQAGVASAAATAHGPAAAVKPVAGVAQAFLGGLSGRVSVRPAVDALADAIERANATIDEMQALAAVLRQAVHEGAEPAVAAARIEQQTPMFGQVGRWLNANPGLLALLAVIATVIAIMNDRAMDSEPDQPPSVHVTVAPPDRDEIERIVEGMLRERDEPTPDEP